MSIKAPIRFAKHTRRLLLVFALLSSLLSVVEPPLEARSKRQRASARGSEPHPSTIMLLTDRAFKDRVFASELPVLVEFGAPWCIGCRAAEPLLEEAAERFAGRAIIAKINTDRFSYWANRFRVTALPTFLIFRDGKIVKRQVGMPDEGLLDRYLGSSSVIASSRPSDPPPPVLVGR